MQNFHKNRSPLENFVHKRFWQNYNKLPNVFFINKNDSQILSACKVVYLRLVHSVSNYSLLKKQKLKYSSLEIDQSHRKERCSKWKR